MAGRAAARHWNVLGQKITYIGQWRDAHRTGSRIIVDKDGSHYQGEVLDGKPHGHGVMTWANGSRYEGDRSDGNKSGQGVQVWKDGARYEGGWKDNKSSGPGVLVDEKGNTWAGTWLGGCMHRPDQRGMHLSAAVGATSCPHYWADATGGGLYRFFCEKCGTASRRQR